MIITDAAAEVIREALRRTSVPKPVVYLIEATPDGDMPPEVASALRHRASEKSIRDALAKTVHLPRYLFPAIYDLTLSRWLFSRKIGGFLFFCPPGLRGEMKRGTLDVAPRGLVLKDAKGAVVRPRPGGL
jgi:hypothetical protein